MTSRPLYKRVKRVMIKPSKYLCGDGILTWLDAKTGTENYKERIHRGIFRASPVYADGKIYCACQDGTVIVVKAGKQFEALATNILNDSINATPVVVNSRIYIRGWNSLYASGKRSSATD